MSSRVSKLARGSAVLIVLGIAALIVPDGALALRQSYTVQTGDIITSPEGHMRVLLSFGSMDLQLSQVSVERLKAIRNTMLDSGLSGDLPGKA